MTIVHPIAFLHRFGLLISIMAISAMAVGCSPKAMDFRSNDLFAFRMERESGGALGDVRNDIQNCLKEWFGTPDEPRWPTGLAVNWSLDLEKLQRSAGPVGRKEDRIERGLYRKHCAVCHGVTGDGYGPSAAMLAPYPRDFRRGTFKFKSTAGGSRPTRDDIKQILVEGIPGTGMPSFQSLTRSRHFENDIDDIVEYVIYLSIRGEVERRLLTVAALEWSERDGRFFDASAAKDSPNYQNQMKRLTIELEQVVQSWAAADVTVQSSSVASIERLDLKSKEVLDPQAIERGRTLFQSQLTGCSSCHGPEGLGNGPSQDFDEWTKDWTIRAGIDPDVPDEWKPLRRLGALKPVRNSPRNLQLGAFRGGAEPEDIFHRIAFGIDGSSMPAVMRSSSHPDGLTDDQIWDLVQFVLSLSAQPGKLR